ncbi:hypothetical protein [Streptomyces sp. NPDC048473]|uniref:hypothetical protein n=1 Tax=Streptomyces sp. NPDC048473 TaxID=3365556 RepID=UPI00371DFB9B
MRHTGHTPADGGQPRPYTLASCGTCGEQAGQAVIGTLRQAVRDSPHAVMVATQCLGHLLDCSAGRGAHLVVQPCTEDRRPSAPAMPLGPVASAEDARTVRAWLMAGMPDVASLPASLLAARPGCAPGT